MKRSYILCLPSLLLAAACADGGLNLRNGDLVFVGFPSGYEVEDSSMAGAISAATGTGKELNIMHVAILELAGDGIWVIDATPGSGVARRPLETFLKEYEIEDGPRPMMIVKRVKGADADAAVERAKAFCGRPYDLKYLPDNEELYCSELVQKCYLNAQEEPVFESLPMNFLTPDGTMPPYWEQLFRNLEMDVPQGVPGTNPQRMSESEHLNTISSSRDL